MNKPMNKPNNPKCDTCFVTNNILRCFNCKYKTKEWEQENMTPIMIRGKKDLYKSKEESDAVNDMIRDQIYPANSVHIGATHPGYGLWVEIDKCTWKRIK